MSNTFVYSTSMCRDCKKPIETKEVDAKTADKIVRQELRQMNDLRGIMNYRPGYAEDVQSSTVVEARCPECKEGGTYFLLEDDEPEKKKGGAA